MARRSIDNRLDFLSPVSFVPGLGPRRVAALKESGIETIGDLLYRFPRRYIDRSVIVPVGKLHEYPGKTCCAIGTVTRTRVERGRRPRFRVQITDDTGTFEALWFHGVEYFRMSIHTGQKLLLTGSVGIYNHVQMVHPLIETLGAAAVGPDIVYLPLYSISEAMRDSGFSQKGLVRSIHWIVENLKHYPQILPEKIVEKKGFPPLPECLRNMHFPDSPALLEKYAARIRYEELYQLALTLRWSRRKFMLPGRIMEAGSMPDVLRRSLPFKLTEEQDRALSVLYSDAAGDLRMHRLLQGDVGSGKTIVAFFACLPALNSGMQAAWMAPTETLAIQTFERIADWLRLFGISPELLTGGIEPEKRRQIYRDSLSGECRFVVGTHALLGPQIKFKKLGMIIIDEQHKFGAQQRMTLAEKDPASDFLLMSATPIPQTLAKTLYGDLDVVTIKAMPEGRIPVQTFIVPETKRRDMEAYIKRQISEHETQAYFVAPRIESVEEGEKLKDINEVSASIERGPLSDVPRAMVHGRMNSGEKDEQIKKFVSGKAEILVATSLIEVGIDVPRAGIIVIENAERFGLSQLHQLRGRVGRGSTAGYCFLMPGERTDEDAKHRLDLFCKTNDGFEISELDLKLRGPGDVAGLRQSGWDELQMADILRDANLFREIQEELDTLLSRKVL